MDKNLISVVFLGVAGLCLLAPGLYSLAVTAKEWGAMESGAGVVTEIRSRAAAKSGGTQMSYAVVRFTASNGREYTVEGARGYSGAPPFSEGAQVAIRYNPVQPEQAVIDTFFEVWGLGALLSLFGGAFLAAALAVHFKSP